MYIVLQNVNNIALEPYPEKHGIMILHLFKYK